MVGLSRVYQAMSTFFCLLGLIGSLVGFTLVIIHLKTRSQLIDSVSFLLKVGQAGRFDLVLIGYQQIIFACSLALCLLIHFVNYVGSTMLKPTVTALNGNLILVGILIVFGLGGSVLSGALFPSRLNVCMTKGMKFGVARHFGFFLSLTRPESLNKSLPVSSTKPWEDTANLHRLQSVYRCCGDRGWRSYRYRQHYTFDQTNKFSLTSVEMMFSCCRSNLTADCLHDNPTADPQASATNDQHFYTTGCQEAISTIYRPYLLGLIWSFALMATADFLDAIAILLLRSLIITTEKALKQLECSKLLEHKDKDEEEEEKKDDDD